MVDKKEYRVTKLVRMPNTSIRMRKEQLVDSWYIRDKYGVDILKKLDSGEKLDLDVVRLEKVVVEKALENLKEEKNEIQS